MHLLAVLVTYINYCLADFGRNLYSFKLRKINLYAIKFEDKTRFTLDSAFYPKDSDYRQ